MPEDLSNTRVRPDSPGAIEDPIMDLLEALDIAPDPEIYAYLAFGKEPGDPLTAEEQEELDAAFPDGETPDLSDDGESESEGEDDTDDTDDTDDADDVDETD